MKEARSTREALVSQLMASGKYGDNMLDGLNDSELRALLNPKTPMHEKQKLMLHGASTSRKSAFRESKRRKSQRFESKKTMLSLTGSPMQPSPVTKRRSRRKLRNTPDLMRPSSLFDQLVTGSPARRRATVPVNLPNLPPLKMSLTKTPQSGISFNTPQRQSMGSGRVGRHTRRSAYGEPPQSLLL